MEKVFSNIQKFLDNSPDALKNEEYEIVRLPLCPLGKERSLITGRCIKTPKNGEARNPITNRIYKI